MHDQVTVLGTFDANLNRNIDTEYNPTIFRWLTLVGPETGRAHRLEGRGHSVAIMLDLIQDKVMAEEAEFVRKNGGAVVLIGLPSEPSKGGEP